MIRVEDISKIFGADPETALGRLREGGTKAGIQAETGQIVGIDRASFALDPGEVFCIMGLSGSGKSTLIRCINRIIEPTAGRILFMDPELGEQDVTAMDGEQLRRLRTYHMSMVFQHFALFPHRTVHANAVFGLEIQGRDKAERDRVGAQVLEMVGLGAWGKAYPSELSGGMQQRVGLARALATQAKVLLMDEPFSALDPLIKVNMQQELVRIQQELERTILFITHDLDEAMRIGDRIAIMEEGRIVQIGTPEEILVNPRTDYVANFVEHADPTAVITAGTIAVPFSEATFILHEERAGLRYYRRRDDGEDGDIRYCIDADGRFHHVVLGERAVEPGRMDTTAPAATGASVRGRNEEVLRCGPATVLRDVLRARVRSRHPVVVTGEDDRFEGIIDEPALVHAILEKRGQPTTEPPVSGDAREAHA